MNKMLQDSYKPYGTGECLDVVYSLPGNRVFVKLREPKVLFIGYGETDEWAHSGHYLDYLDAAHQVDQWINDIWTFIQTLPEYKNKTALFITTDHGRGDLIKSEWTSHYNKIAGANEIWFAAMGKGIPVKGEVKLPEQYFQEQFAQTMAHLLGLHFTCEHPVGNSYQFEVA
jgi:bisphosphoglycerate-independent phosphoglycerate mutase (AlkP superfamily)